MRAVSLIALFLVSLLRLSAQAVAPQPSDPPVSPEDAAFDKIYPHRTAPMVEGRILHLAPEECRRLTISYTLVTPFASFQSKRTCTLADDGSFILKTDYALPRQQIWLQVGDLYYGGLYVDTQLRIVLDAQKLKAANGISFFGDGVSFEGADGPLNAYLSKYLTLRSPEQQHLEMRRQMLIQQARSNPDPFVPGFWRLTDSLETMESAFIGAHPSPFSAILHNENRSASYGLLFAAYWNKRMPDSLWTKLSRHKAWCVSNDGSQYYNYLATYIQYCQGPRRTSIEATLQRIDSLFPPSRADFFKMRLGSLVEIDSQQKALKAISTSVHTAWCAAVIRAETQQTDKNVAEINKALAAAKPPANTAPDANATTSSGTAANAAVMGQPLMIAPFGATLYNSLDTSASDLLSRIARAYPGKAIILDRWATWCEPCIAEMPHSKQLQQDAEELPVVFIYLCTRSGSSQEKWQTSVFNLKQPGIHIFINEKLDAEISTYFSFHGYPGYAFIGRDGKYKPGAITWMSEIADRKSLETLIAR